MSPQARILLDKHIDDVIWVGRAGPEVYDRYVKDMEASFAALDAHITNAERKAALYDQRYPR